MEIPNCKNLNTVTELPAFYSHFTVSNKNQSSLTGVDHPTMRLDRFYSPILRQIKHILYVNHPPTKRLHLPQHNAKRPYISFEAVVVVLEVFRGVPAQWHACLYKTHNGKSM